MNFVKPSIFKDLKMLRSLIGGLLGYEIVGWKYFSFRIFKALLLCVLASETIEKMKTICISNLLHETIFFFLLKVFFLCPNIQNIQLMHPDGSLFIYFVGPFLLLSFLELTIFSSGEFP